MITISKVDELTDDVISLVNISNGLTKSLKDIDNVYFEWQEIQENIMETELLRELNRIKMNSIKNVDLLELIYDTDDYKKFFTFMRKTKYDEKVSFIKAGIYIFQRNTFPLEINEYFEKAGNKNVVKPVIDIISEINDDPFDKAFFNNMKKSHLKGGQSMMSMFNIPMNFKIIDENVTKWLSNHSLALTKGITTHISSQIKGQILSGIKNGEGVNQIRNRILGVWDKPIQVKVPPKVSATGKIVRKGYNYNVSAKNWATTVARTEVSRSFVEGKLQAYAQSGVIQTVEYVTAEDEKTCKVCMPFHGRVYNLTAAVGLIPMHGKCRCSFIPRLKCNELLSKSVIVFTLSKANVNNKCYLAAQKKMKSNLAQLYKKKGKNQEKTWAEWHSEMGFKHNEALKLESKIDDILGPGTSPDMFEAAYKIPGHNVKLEYTVHEGELSVYGEIFKGGKYLGDFEVGYTKLKNILKFGEMYAEAEVPSFFIGYKKMLKSVKDLHTMLQVGKVGEKVKKVKTVVQMTKTAKTPVAKKSMPKMGYDWADEQTALKMQKKFQAWISKNAKVYKPKNIKIKFDLDVSDFNHPWDFSAWEGQIKHTYLKGKDFLASLDDYQGLLSLEEGAMSNKIYTNVLGKSNAIKKPALPPPEAVPVSTVDPIITGKNVGSKVFNEWYKKPANKKKFDAKAKKVRDTLNTPKGFNPNTAGQWQDFWEEIQEELMDKMYKSMGTYTRNTMRGIFDDWYGSSSSDGGSIIKMMASRFKKSKVTYNRRNFIDSNAKKMKKFEGEYRSALREYGTSDSKMTRAFEIWMDYNRALNKAMFGRIKTLEIERGVNSSWLKSNKVSTGKNKKIQMNSASSWTTNKKLEWGEIGIKGKFNLDDMIASWWSSPEFSSFIGEAEVIFTPTKGKIIANVRWFE